MEKINATGKFINTCMSKPSVLSDEKYYSALFEEDNGKKYWINITEMQYRKIKCQKHVDIEYLLGTLDNGAECVTLAEMKRRKQ